MKAHRPKMQPFSDAARRKDYETRKKNGTLRVSYAELTFVAYLRSRFGTEDIVHHPPMLRGTHHQPDVWIASLDLYVEFDGVYWHGLDRPYEQLSTLIRKKYDRDRRFDAHCAKHGIRLVRVKDVDWTAMSTSQRNQWCDSL